MRPTGNYIEIRDVKEFSRNIASAAVAGVPERCESVSVGDEVAFRASERIELRSKIYLDIKYILFKKTPLLQDA